VSPRYFSNYLPIFRKLIFVTTYSFSSKVVSPKALTYYPSRLVKGNPRKAFRRFNDILS
jgi:hypothetical protein